MIHLPLEWGAVSPGGKSHAWVTKESGRRASLCSQTPDEEQDRWSFPDKSNLESCATCLRRAGCAEIYEESWEWAPMLPGWVSLQPNTKMLLSYYPHATPISDMYRAFPLLANQAVRDVVFRMLLDEGLVYRITSPGPGERYLASRKLREEHGVATIGMASL